MAELHDGDLFNLNPGTDNPVYVEYLATNGRLAWRLVDKYGHGILLERSAMDRFSILIDIALGRKFIGSLDDFENTNRNKEPK